MRPVVSLSVGQSGLFRFGNPVGRGRPWVDVVLESGDVVVFGGPSRRSYHGVHANWSRGRATRGSAGCRAG